MLEWNLAADPQQNPHTSGGCTEYLGAITLDGNAVTRNLAYYVIAHASKFVRSGSVRIASTTLPTLPNVAFRAPNGNCILMVQNSGATPQDFNIHYHGKLLATALPPGAVGTYVW